MRRSEIRELIFQLLYQLNFSSEEDRNEQVSFFMEENGVSDELSEFITHKVKKVIEHVEEIDSLIEQYAKGWKIGRMNKVDLAILRLAIFEITHENEEDIPDKVAINEAIELAKKYSDDKAYGFINGILGSIIKELGRGIEGENE